MNYVVLSEIGTIQFVKKSYKHKVVYNINQEVISKVNIINSKYKVYYMTVQKIKKKDNEMRKICMIEVLCKNQGIVL